MHFQLLSLMWDYKCTFWCKILKIKSQVHIVVACWCLEGREKGEVVARVDPSWSCNWPGSRCSKKVGWAMLDRGGHRAVVQEQHSCHFLYNDDTIISSGHTALFNTNLTHFAKWNPVFLLELQDHVWETRNVVNTWPAECHNLREIFHWRVQVLLNSDRLNDIAI